MAATLTDNAPTTLELGSRESQRVLEQACRAGARATIVPQTGHQPTLLGTLATLTAESLWLDMDRTSPASDAARQSACCDVTLGFRESRYLFATNVVSTVQAEGESRLEVARPDTVCLLQRRRFWRARLAESTGVRLRRVADGDDGVNGPAWDCRASMLNVSPDGLACLVTRRDADATVVGQRLHVEFALSAVQGSFVMNARLKAKTPAGTDGAIVLGLQLEPAAGSEQRRRLARALERLA